MLYAVLPVCRSSAYTGTGSQLCTEYILCGEGWRPKASFIDYLRYDMMRVAAPALLIQLPTRFDKTLPRRTNYEMAKMKYLAALLLLSLCQEAKANQPPSEVNEGLPQRQLVVFEALAGYQPKSLITDEAAIDLDLETLEEIISTKSFRKSLPIYTQGGHSDSYAALQIRSRQSTSILLDEGQQVFGIAQNGTTVQGVVRASVTTHPGTFAGSEKSSLLSVSYDISSLQDAFVGCQVGALEALGQADFSGCKFKNLKPKNKENSNVCTNTSNART
jgi:hypothetical protein